MLTAEVEGDRMVWVEPQEVSAMVECPSGLAVTMTGCQYQYLDATAKRRSVSPCFNCPKGRERRVSVAGGYEEPAPRRGGRPKWPATMKTPLAWAQERKVHLLEAVQSFRPNTTGAELRRWIEEAKWPEYCRFREKLAEKLGVKRSEVKWR